MLRHNWKEKMGQYGEGMEVWAWAPELEEAIDGPLRPEERGWYPAEIASINETDGQMLLNVFAYDDGVVGDGGKGVWAVSIAVDLEDAEVWVRPRDGSSSPMHKPMVMPVFLGYVSPKPEEN